jgi:hypothetical protein
VVAGLAHGAAENVFCTLPWRAMRDSGDHYVYAIAL